MRTARVSRLQLIGAAALFSTGGAAIKSCALTSWQVASFRSGIACLAFLAMVPAARRMPSWREIVVGLGYAASMVTFVMANKLTTSGNAIFLQSTAPIYILFLAPLLLHEKITRRDVAFLAAIGAGVVAFFIDEQKPLGTAPEPFLGNMVALSSGLAWALTVIGIRWLSGASTRPSSTASELSPASGVGAVVVGNALAFLVCAAPAFSSAIPPDASGSPVRRWVLIAYLGVFQIALAYVLLTSAMRRVQAFEASVLLLVEPVLNPVWAFVVHGERPGAWAILGGVVIVASTAIKTWWDVHVEAQTPTFDSTRAQL
jgi:drug/metabolite transporter (DMT)-like permease